MEIFIDVWIEDRESGIKNKKANEAIYTFVAVDETGRPPVPPIEPETELEKQRYEAKIKKKTTKLSLSWKN